MNIYVYIYICTHKCKYIYTYIYIDYVMYIYTNIYIYINSCQYPTPHLAHIKTQTIKL